MHITFHYKVLNTNTLRHFTNNDLRLLNTPEGIAAFPLAHDIISSIHNENDFLGIYRDVELFAVIYLQLDELWVEVQAEGVSLEEFLRRATRFESSFRERYTKKYSKKEIKLIETQFFITRKDVFYVSKYNSFWDYLKESFQINQIFISLIGIFIAFLIANQILPSNEEATKRITCSITASLLIISCQLGVILSGAGLKYRAARGFSFRLSNRKDTL